MKEVQPGIFRRGGKLYTEAASTESVYGESFVEVEDEKFRGWSPSRSKVGAAVMNGVDLGIEKDSEVLYLGAASGTTVSHLSDIAQEGFIYGVEVSETVIRDLVTLAEDRSNIAPILEDARKPENYEELVDGKVDTVFQDVSQRDQPEIFLRNVEKFLKDDGTGLLAVKARSISSSRTKEEIFGEVREKIREKMEIVDETELDPYEKEHLFLKLKKK